MGVECTFRIDGKELVVHALYRHDPAAHNAARVVISHHHVSYVTKDGRMFSTRVQNHSKSYGTRWTARPDIIRDAIALGCVPRGKLERIMALEEKKRKRHEQQTAANDLLNNAETAGLVWTADQAALLRRLAKTRKA